MGKTCLNFKRCDSLNTLCKTLVSTSPSEILIRSDADMKYIAEQFIAIKGLMNGDQKSVKNPENALIESGKTVEDFKSIYVPTLENLFAYVMDMGDASAATDKIILEIEDFEFMFLDENILMRLQEYRKYMETLYKRMGMAIIRANNSKNSSRVPVDVVLKCREHLPCLGFFTDISDYAEYTYYDRSE